MRRIEKAIKYIKGYCDKNPTCDKCKLYNKEEDCCQLKEELPCEWKITWLNRDNSHISQ